MLFHRRGFCGLARLHVTAVTAKKMKLFDPLEALKHLEGDGGPNCIILGNKPSSDLLLAFSWQNINTE